MRRDGSPPAGTPAEHVPHEPHDAEAGLALGFALQEVPPAKLAEGWLPDEETVAAFADWTGVDPGTPARAFDAGTLARLTGVARALREGHGAGSRDTGRIVAAAARADAAARGRAERDRGWPRGVRREPETLARLVPGRTNTLDRPDVELTDAVARIGVGADTTEGNALGTAAAARTALGTGDPAAALRRLTTALQRGGRLPRVWRTATRAARDMLAEGLLVDPATGRVAAELPGADLTGENAIATRLAAGYPLLALDAARRALDSGEGHTVEVLAGQAAAAAAAGDPALALASLGRALAREPANARHLASRAAVLVHLDPRLAPDPRSAIDAALDADWSRADPGEQLAPLARALWERGGASDAARIEDLLLARGVGGRWRGIAAARRLAPGFDDETRVRWLVAAAAHAEAIDALRGARLDMLDASEGGSAPREPTAPPPAGSPWRRRARSLRAGFGTVLPTLLYAATRGGTQHPPSGLAAAEAKAWSALVVS